MEDDNMKTQKKGKEGETLFNIKRKYELKWVTNDDDFNRNRKRIKTISFKKILHSAVVGIKCINDNNNNNK